MPKGKTGAEKSWNRTQERQELYSIFGDQLPEKNGQPTPECSEPPPKFQDFHDAPEETGCHLFSNYYVPGTNHSSEMTVIQQQKHMLYP